MIDTVLDLRSAFINKGCVIPDVGQVAEQKIHKYALACQGTSRDNQRLNEYIKGFSSIKEHENTITKHADIIVSDNTIDSKEEIDPNILKHIPTCAKFNLANKNKYGQQNKGAGLIEYWRHSANIYSRYKWVLFYESRLFLEDFSFFNSFFDDKRTMFKYGADCASLGGFFTGMFAARTKDILNFCNNINLNNFTLQGQIIEQILYFYYRKNNITYKNVGALGIVWLEHFAKTRNDEGRKGWRL